MYRRRWALRVILLLLVGTGLACHAWAHAHYRAAQRALARRDLAEAQRHLAQSLKVWFWRADTYLLAARTARRAGDFDQANTYLRRCRALGGPEEALDLEYKLLSVQQGDLVGQEGSLVNLVRQGHPDEARQLLERLLAKEPRNGLALQERGRLALQFESAAEAEKWLRRAAAEQPAEREVLYGLLQCLKQLHKDKEAAQVQAQLAQIDADLARLAVVTRQIAATPHDAGLRCEAGQIMLRNGQETEGLRWLASALHEDPSHADTLQTLEEHMKKKEAEKEKGRGEE